MIKTLIVNETKKKKLKKYAENSSYSKKGNSRKFQKQAQSSYRNHS